MLATVTKFGMDWAGFPCPLIPGFTDTASKPLNFYSVSNRGWQKKVKAAVIVDLLGNLPRQARLFGQSLVGMGGRAAPPCTVSVFGRIQPPGESQLDRARPPGG